jgi:hypothetical protein
MIIWDSLTSFTTREPSTKKNTTSN